MADKTPFPRRRAMGILVLSPAQRKVVQSGGAGSRPRAESVGLVGGEFEAEWWRGSGGERGEQTGRGADGTHDPERDSNSCLSEGAFSSSRSLRACSGNSDGLFPEILAGHVGL